MVLAQKVDSVATVMSKLQAELTAALLRLQRAGYPIRASNRPGLTCVDGKLLTVPQIFDLVSNLK